MEVRSMAQGYLHVLFGSLWLFLNIRHWGGTSWSFGKTSEDTNPSDVCIPFLNTDVVGLHLCLKP